MCTRGVWGGGGKGQGTLKLDGDDKIATGVEETRTRLDLKKLGLLFGGSLVWVPWKRSNQEAEA